MGSAVERAGAVATALAGQKHRPILVHIETAPQAGSRVRAAYELQVAHFKPYREHSLAMPFLDAITPAASAKSAAATSAILRVM